MGAEDFLRQYARRVTPQGVTLLCSADHLERLEARNQERLSEYIFEFRRRYPGRDPLRTNVILEMHAITVADIYPSAGRFRVMSEDVDVPGAGFRPAPTYRIEAEVNDLLGRLGRVRDQPGRFAWRLRYAALALHRFLRIHPFLDGNGRVGRALHLLALYELGLLEPPEQVFDFFKAYRAEYLSALRAADAGEFRPWITLNEIAVLDWHRQRFYTRLLAHERLGPYVLERLNRNQRRMLSRAYRLRLRLSSHIHRSVGLDERLSDVFEGLPRVVSTDGGDI